MLNGPAHTAAFNQPTGIAVDSFGHVYVADYGNHRIRKIDATTGNVTTLAGDGTAGNVNGLGTAARLRNPHGLAIDSLNNLYVAELGNHLIRKIDTATGQTSTYAGMGTSGFLDGPAATARFASPRGVDVDTQGNVYVADTANHRIRKIETNGNVITLAGTGSIGTTNGAGNVARFYNPYDLTVTFSGDIYVADQVYNSIRRIDTQNNVTLYAGGTSSTGDFVDANSTTARFNNPSGIKRDSSGFLYIADAGNHRIRRIDLQANVTTYSGRGFFRGATNGSSLLSRFNNPQGMAYDSQGNLYIADTGNHRIRMVDTQGNVTTFAGTGTAGLFEGPRLQARFSSPTALVFDTNGNLFITDASNFRVRMIDPTGEVTTFAGGTSTGTADGAATDARFSSSMTEIIRDNQNNLYITDRGNHRIRVITPAGIVSTLAGSTSGFLNALGTAARFNGPRGLAIGPNGNLYVADESNNRIRMISLAPGDYGNVTTAVGSGTQGLLDGPAATARFNSPMGIAIDNNGNLFIADRLNYRLRKLDTNGNVTSVGGDSRAGFRDGIGPDAFLNYPFHLIFSPSGDLLFSDYTNAVIRRLR